MSQFKTRGFISILLSITFLIVVTSGLVLWLAHAPQTFGIGKGVWKHSHIFVSLLMVLAGVVHICLNWKVYWSYLWEGAGRRLNQKWELALALGITGLVLFTATLGGDDGMQRLGAASLKQLAEQSGKPVDQIVAVLKKEGIVVSDTADSVLKISQQNSQSPMAVLGVLQREMPELMKPARGGH